MLPPEQIEPLLLIRAEIREAFYRRLDRRPEEWEERFFLRFVMAGEVNKEGLEAVLGRTDEAKAVEAAGRLYAWPMVHEGILLSGWN